MPFSIDNGQEYLQKGMEWVRAPAWDGWGVEAIAWSPELSRGVALGYSPYSKLFTTTDGVNWNAEADLPDRLDAKGVVWAAGLGLFVAVGDFGTYRAATSPDGVTWTMRTPSLQAWRRLVWSESQGILVAVCEQTSSNVMVSSDGITWNVYTAAGTSNGFRDISYSPSEDIFVAVGDGNHIYSSADGVTWNSRTSFDANYQWSSATWSESIGKFFAVNWGLSSNEVISSADGITWSAPGNILTGTHSFSSVVADDVHGFVVAFSDNDPSIYYTENGSSWSESSSFNIGGADTERPIYVPSINRFMSGLNDATDAYLHGSSNSLTTLWKPYLGEYIPATPGNPGQPYIPSIPGYWEVVETTGTRYIPHYVNMLCEDVPSWASVGAFCSPGQIVPVFLGYSTEEYTIVTNVWHPSVPAQQYIAPTPPTEAQVIGELNSGWNSFSVSDWTLQDGVAWFYTPESTAGVFVGFIPEGSSGNVSPYDILYGVYITNGDAFAYEKGVGLTYLRSGIDEATDISLYKTDTTETFDLEIDFTPSHTYSTFTPFPVRLQVNLWQGGDSIIDFDYFDTGFISSHSATTLPLGSVVGFGAEADGGDGSAYLGSVTAEGAGEGAALGSDGWAVGLLQSVTAGGANYGFRPGIDAQENFAAGVGLLSPVTATSGGSSTTSDISGGVTADLPPPFITYGMTFVASVGGVGLGLQSNAGTGTPTLDPVIGLGWDDAFASDNIGEGAAVFASPIFSFGQAAQVGEGFTVGVFGYAALTLPLPTLSAVSNVTEADGGTMVLPVPTLAAAGGGTASLALPAPTLTIAATWPGIGRLDEELPGLTLTAAGRGSLAPISAYLELPAFTVTGSTGWRAELSIPSVSLTATGITGAVGRATLPLPSLELRALPPLGLPALTLAAYGGGSATLAVPAPTLAAYGGGSAELSLPPPTLTAEGTNAGALPVGVRGYTALDLPILALSAGGAHSAALALPSVSLTATGKMGTLGGASLELPSLALVAQASRRLQWTVTAGLPQIRLNAAGSSVGADPVNQMVLPTLRLAA